MVARLYKPKEFRKHLCGMKLLRRVAFFQKVWFCHHLSFAPPNQNHLLCEYREENTVLVL